MSEMLMFHKKKALNGEKYTARYSHAVLNIASDLYPAHAVNTYTAQKEHHNTSRYRYSNYPTIMTNAIFMAANNDRVALSVGVGNNFGADATLRLLGQTYLTGTIDAYRQGQVILQERLLDGNFLGLSLGASYIRNYQYVEEDIDTDCTLCFPHTEYYTHSFGIRAVGLFAPPANYGKSKFFIHVTGSINYDTGIKVVYPRIGIAFGVY